MPITQTPKAKARLVTESMAPRKWARVVLITSSTTLICCALPILLVSIGLGAVSASLFANLPFLVTLAHYQAWMFAASGGVLVLTAWPLYRPNRMCPADPELAELCDKAHRWNTRFFWVSVGIWMAGFGTAYLALPIYSWLEGG